MTKETKAKEELKRIRELADINESYYVGLLWAYPLDNYTAYGSFLDGDSFLHKNWGFFHDLGYKLYKKGLEKFDDISVNTTVKELGIEKLFEEYGGLEAMYDLINIVKENNPNVEAYFEAMQKNVVIQSYIEMFGAKVVLKNKKYDYTEMNAREISAYWQDKVNQVSLKSLANYDSENLYINADDFIESFRNQEAGLLPFHYSSKLNSVVRGIPRGEVTMLGGFGNSGKSSFMADKILMACLESDEKTLVILNEEGADKLREKMFLSIANKIVSTKENPVSFPRWKFKNVDLLTDEEKSVVETTFKEWHRLTNGDDAKIKVVFMEQYNISDLKNIVALYANRGYVNLIIDTHKVPDGYSTASRWEAIVEATKEIYKFTRKESGGLNLRTVLTIQLADSHIKDRFLGYDAIGEGKGMKNEASVLMMYRPLFADEYDKIEPYTLEKSGLSGNNKWTKSKINLDKEKTYYVMFIPKNRNGANTDSGQDCILYEPDFEYNSFREVGFVKIDRNYL